MHPGFVPLVTFDQSTNHAAFADDALRASKMQFHPGGKQALLRDGWFGPIKKIQSIVIPSNHEDPKMRGLAKRLKVVLQERGLYEVGMKMDCGA